MVIVVRQFGFGLLRFCGVCAGYREKNLETGDAARAMSEASESDSAAVFLHDAFAYPKAEAGALGGFGAEEWLEKALGIFRYYPDSGSENGYGSAATLLHQISGFSCVHTQNPAGRHSLNRVADRVQ